MPFLPFNDGVSYRTLAECKARGIYKGRKPSVDAGEVQRLRTEGMRPTEIAAALKISRSTVWRVLKGKDSE